MRISDWSSDVCSSDLPRIHQRGHAIGIFHAQREACDSPIIWPEARFEHADHRAARILAIEPRNRDQYIGRAELIEHHPPPAAITPPDLAEIEQQRVRSRARGADIIDRTAAGAETRPRLLPPGTAFEAPGDAAAPRSEEHTSELPP